MVLAPPSERHWRREGLMVAPKRFVPPDKKQRESISCVF
jgi:hypothetical protein